MCATKLLTWEMLLRTASAGEERPHRVGNRRLSFVYTLSVASPGRVCACVCVSVCVLAFIGAHLLAHVSMCVCVHLGPFVVTPGPTLHERTQTDLQPFYRVALRPTESA